MANYSLHLLRSDDSSLVTDDEIGVEDSSSNFYGAFADTEDALAFIYEEIEQQALFGNTVIFNS